MKYFGKSSQISVAFVVATVVALIFLWVLVRYSTKWTREGFDESDVERRLAAVESKIKKYEDAMQSAMKDGSELSTILFRDVVSFFTKSSMNQAMNLGMNPGLTPPGMDPGMNQPILPPPAEFTFSPNINQTATLPPGAVWGTKI
jgi:hypothetical protein